MMLSKCLGAALLAAGLLGAPTGAAMLEGSAPTAAPAQSDSDLGCCVLESDPVTCFATNRAYCRDRAKKADVQFKFQKDKSCRDLDECKQKSSRGPGNSGD